MRESPWRNFEFKEYRQTRKGARSGRRPSILKPGDAYFGAGAILSALAPVLDCLAMIISFILS
jgi:hypothetical protein